MAVCDAMSHHRLCSLPTCDCHSSRHIITSLQRLLQPLSVLLTRIDDVNSDIIAELLRDLFQRESSGFGEVGVYD